MDSGKVKSVFIFIILVAVLFYFGNLTAREAAFSIADTDQSVQFLETVAVLDAIDFDLDFVNSLGGTAIRTDVYVQPLSPSDAGRDNPFRRSNPSTLFQSSQDVFSGQGDVRSIQEILSPSASSDDSQSPVEKQGAVVPVEESEEDSEGVPQNVSVPPAEEQSPATPKGAEEGESENPPESPSATLTR